MPFYLSNMELNNSYKICLWWNSRYKIRHDNSIQYKQICSCREGRKNRRTRVQLTLMLLLAYLANTKWCKKPEKLLKPWQMGTHLKALNESYPMNTNMTGFWWFSHFLRSCALDKSSLSIGRVNWKHLSICLIV